jgi:hypothetical protein
LHGLPAELPSAVPAFQSACRFQVKPALGVQEAGKVAIRPSSETVTIVLVLADWDNFMGGRLSSHWTRATPQGFQNSGKNTRL